MKPSKELKVIIILGPPGSGKGTQAKLIAKEYYLRNISIGSVLRREVKNRTKLGLKIKPYIERGDLAPDHIVYKIVKKYIKKGNFILDGFPRHMSQVKIIKENIKHRKDDEKETIEYRWLIYKNQSLPVVNHYKKKGLLIKIKGNPGERTVFKEIKEKLNRLF